MSSIDMERFRNDINRYRNKTGMPWAALAEKAGVSPAMFTRIKKGSAVTLEAFAQLCSSFQLNPIDYMPELQTKPTKEQPMEDVKRLSIDGKDFTIEDVELRSGPAWANGPRRADAELPDGQVLGSIMASDGEWLWRLAGEKWNHTEPAEGPITEYIGHEPNRLSAIRSLLQAIEDRYSNGGRRPMGIHAGRSLHHHAGCRQPDPTGTGRGSLGFGLPRRERPARPGSRHRPRRHASHRTRDRNVKGDGHHA